MKSRITNPRHRVKAIQSIKTSKKIDILTNTATDAKNLLKEAKGDINRYKNYTNKQYKKVMKLIMFKTKENYKLVMINNI
ncbi:Uncharacterised protein [Elizabethkingia anophelis]|uniref:Uncharacterized protein n=1 Tax=Elizabethkingia anophelis TaxID=1117645 RepID=A0A7Z7LU56_9FLAO|nr:Uncharacterised protein [Elizabethkingia anophelis]